MEQKSVKGNRLWEEIGWSEPGAARRVGVENRGRGVNQMWEGGGTGKKNKGGGKGWKKKGGGESGMCGEKKRGQVRCGVTEKRKKGSRVSWQKPPSGGGRGKGEQGRGAGVKKGRTQQFSMGRAYGGR